MKKRSRISPKGENTRAALIEAAVKIFARDGFGAAATRDIAREAGVNQALITYHFRGKMGLYLAIFETFIESFRTHILSFRKKLDRELAHAAKAGPEKSRKILGALVIELCDTMLNLVLQPEKKLWAQLVVREQQNPGEAFEFLFKGLFNPMLTMLAKLIRAADPERSADDVEITAAGIMGQIVIWRVGRTALLRRLGQNDTEEPQIGRIRKTIHKNILVQIFPSGEKA